MKKPEPPKVFISYSWDTEDHRSWVRFLAEQLCLNGVDARLDQWYVSPGNSITQFMEEEARYADFVLIVCTPLYAVKSNARKGGIGYEQQIISGQLFYGISRSRYIPILRSGEFEPGQNCAIPAHFMGIATVDCRDNSKFDERLEEILRTIFSRPKYASPPLGNSPVFETVNKTDFPIDENLDNDRQIHSSAKKRINSEVDYSILGKMSREEILNILKEAKGISVTNYNDGEIYLSIALCYLQLGIYDLAIKNFKQAQELMPEYSDCYYYNALAVIRGRRPKTLSLKEVRKIEQYVEAAVQLNDKPAKYYYLAAIIKYDYYVANGLTLKPPTHVELLETAKKKVKDPWEIERLLNSIILRDDNLISFVRNS